MLYSWDLGLSWKSLEISKKKFIASALFSGASYKELVFIVEGTYVKQKKKQEEGEEVSISIDFSDFQQKECKGHENPD